MGSRTLFYSVVHMTPNYSLMWTLNLYTSSLLPHTWGRKPPTQENSSCRKSYISKSSQCSNILRLITMMTCFTRLWVEYRVGVKFVSLFLQNDRLRWLKLREFVFNVSSGVGVTNPCREYRICDLWRVLSGAEIIGQGGSQQWSSNVWPEIFYQNSMFVICAGGLGKCTSGYYNLWAHVSFVLVWI